MINAWSLLFDELNMTEHSEHYYDFDRNDLNRKNPFAENKISFSECLNSTSYVDGEGTDTLSLDSESLTFNVSVPKLPDTPKNENGFWKYHEDVILKEIRDYLGGTYRSHYASPESQTQTLDLIEGIGDAEPFCRSNAIKYLSRFGKKGGKSKQDILKAIHYCILLYHFAGLCNETSTPYETF